MSGTIRIGHDVAKAILNTIDHEEVDAVLLGWRGRSRRQDFVFGSNVDEVITKARCDVLVERIGPRPESVGTILLPTAGGPHAEFAAEVAGSIARTNDASVRVVNVVAPGATDDEYEEATRKVEHVASLFEDVSVETAVVEGRNVTDTIVDMTADHDITLIGASREGLFQQLLFGAIPEAVGQRAENTVIMAKRNRGILSRMRRWFWRRNG